MRYIFLKKVYHLQKNEIYSYKKSLLFNDSSGNYFTLFMGLTMARYRLISLYLDRYIFERSIKYKIIKYLSDMESYDYYIEILVGKLSISILCFFL